MATNNPEWYIYALTDKTGATRYVGCAMDLGRRMCAHRKRFDWFADYEILAVCTDSWQAREREIAEIRQARAGGANLANRQHNRTVSGLTVDALAPEPAQALDPDESTCAPAVVRCACRLQTGSRARSCRLSILPEHLPIASLYSK